MKRTQMVTLPRSFFKKYEPDPQHEEWRDKVLERDGHQCRWIDPSTKERCRNKRRITAHHISERSQRPDLRYDVANGAALCWDHHDRAHHTVQGRAEAKAQGLLGGETYEKAHKR